MKKLLLLAALISTQVLADTQYQVCKQAQAQLTITVDPVTIKSGETVAPHYSIISDVQYNPYWHPDYYLFVDMVANGAMAHRKELFHAGYRNAFEGSLPAVSIVAPGVYDSMVHAWNAPYGCDLIARERITVT